MSHHFGSDCHDDDCWCAPSTAPQQGVGIQREFVKPPLGSEREFVTDLPDVSAGIRNGAALVEEFLKTQSMASDAWTIGYNQGISEGLERRKKMKAKHKKRCAKLLAEITKAYELGWNHGSADSID